MDKAAVMTTAALTVALDRAGGHLEYTQSEFLAVRAKRGDYVISTTFDKSGPGEPVIRVTLEPKAGGTMPVT